MTTVPTDTSTRSDAPAARRRLEFHCFNCLRGELDRLEAAGEANIRAVGRWTPGQVVQHLAEVVTRSIDGFEFEGPRLVRMLRPVLRLTMMGRPMPSGVKLKGAMTAMVPPPSIRFDNALANLRRELDRAERERMTAKSPVFGRMTHDDWANLHLRHAELHLGFLHPSS